MEHKKGWCTIVQLSSMMRQLSKGNDGTQSYGDMVSHPLISLVNETATRFKVRDGATIAQCVLAMQANEYLVKYDDILPDYIKTEGTPRQIIAALVKLGKITGAPYPFPRIKDPQAHDMGHYFTFSPKQSEIINYKAKRSDFIFMEGSVRSSKTTASAFLHARTYLTSGAGNHAIIGYSMSQISRVALTPLEKIIPWMKKYQGNESIRLVMKSIIEPYENVEIYLVSGNNSSSMSRVLGTNLATCWVEEINTIHPPLLYVLNDRMAADKRKRWVATTNPLNVKSELIQFLKMFNHGAESTTESNGNFIYRHFTVYDNPAMTPQMIEDMQRELKDQTYLYTTRFLGLRAKPDGLVVSQFDESRNVTTELPKNPRGMQCFLSVDAGYTDAFCAGIFLQYWENSEPHCILLGEYYHKENVYCSMPRVELKALSAAEHIQNICEATTEILRGLEQYYDPKEFGKVTRLEILIDPAAKGERVAFNNALDWDLYHGMRGFDVRKANNNGRDAKGLGQGAGVQFGFTRLNTSFHVNRLHILKTPEILGVTGLDTRKCVEELQSYTRDEKTGEIPLSGKNHYDSPHYMRYANNFLATYFWRDNDWPKKHLERCTPWRCYTSWGSSYFQSLDILFFKLTT